MAIEALEERLQASAKRGAYPIPLSAETTAGFLGRTERGPVNEPVLVESYPEFCRYFGKHLAGSAVAFAVRDFFLHGGRRSVIVRLTNRARRARIDVPADGGVLRLEARHPGRHENLRISIDYEQAGEDSGQFNLVVQRISAQAGRSIEDQEIYPQVSVRESDDRNVATVLRNSNLVALAGPVSTSRPDATPPVRPGEPVRYIGLTEAGGDGDELTDYDIIGSDRDGSGLFAFSRGPRIDLLAIPLPSDRELGTTAMLAAARYCQRNRALMIWEPPAAWQSADAALLGARRLDQASSSMMCYFPRIRPRGTRARFSEGLSACGAIAGMLALRDRRGTFGRDQESDYCLRAALTPVTSLTATEAQRLARYGVNCFVQTAGGAARLVGHVTLGSSAFASSMGRSLDSRRLEFFILNSIEDAARAAFAQADTAVLRIEWQLRRFFEDLYLHGALQGKTPGQAYRLEKRPAMGKLPAAIRFGFALGKPGCFAEYELSAGSDQPFRVERVPGLEAEQAFYP